MIASPATISAHLYEVYSWWDSLPAAQRVGRRWLAARPGDAYAMNQLSHGGGAPGGHGVGAVLEPAFRRRDRNEPRAPAQARPAGSRSTTPSNRRVMPYLSSSSSAATGRRLLGVLHVLARPGSPARGDGARTRWMVSRASAARGSSTRRVAFTRRSSRSRWAMVVSAARLLRVAPVLRCAFHVRLRPHGAILPGAARELECRWPRQVTRPRCA